MTIARPPIGRWLLLQLALVGLISALFLFKSPNSAASSAMGGLIFWVPHCYFVLKAFAHTGAQAALRMVQTLQFGEAVKLLLTAALFALVFAVVDPLDAMALLFTFAVMVASNILVPLGLRHLSPR
ncbi:MAG: ATP synthase subunit I [Oleiphilaceae bacterium]|nr:ATP synthase subunit I [Oleiphilaceae bacterium]